LGCFGLCIDYRTPIEGVLEQGTEENIGNWEEGNADRTQRK
jgi:hypothetical protein